MIPPHQNPLFSIPLAEKLEKASPSSFRRPTTIYRNLIYCIMQYCRLCSVRTVSTSQNTISSAFTTKYVRTVLYGSTNILSHCDTATQRHYRAYTPYSTLSSWYLRPTVNAYCSNSNIRHQQCREPTGPSRKQYHTPSWSLPQLPSVLPLPNPLSLSWALSMPESPNSSDDVNFPELIGRGAFDGERPSSSSSSSSASSSSSSSSSALMVLLSSAAISSSS